MRRILFLDQVHPILWTKLMNHGFSCVDLSMASRAEILDVLEGYEGIVTRSRLRIDRELLSSSSTLRWVARWGVGTEHIDLPFAAERNVTVFTSPEGSRDTVGEHTIGLMLMLLNHLGRADREVRTGKWKRAPNRGTELGEKTVGIIGYGNMGQSTARRLSGFGCRVIAHDKFRTGYADAFAEAVSLEELQRDADIVSLHIPLEGNTFYADAAWFAQFAKPIYLINTARGKILRTSDLVTALESKRVLGAALDVLEYEAQSFTELEADERPVDLQYLMDSDRVVLNPHIAGWSHEAEEKHGQVLSRKIIDFPV